MSFLGFGNSDYSFKFLNLRAITYMYLALPVLIWTVGWLKMLFAIEVLIILLFISFLILKKDSIEVYKTNDLFTTALKVIIFCIVVFGFTALSGIGSIGFQNGDHLKHNAILHDLVFNQWPVFLESLNGGSYLHYYFAYYLPAALAGKAFGLGAAKIVLFVWSACGVGLALLWLSKLTGRRLALVLPFFILFGGLDFVGNILVNLKSFNGTEHMEVWNSLWLQYSSNTTLLFWVPQHGIPGWLFISLIIYESVIEKKFSHIAFYASLTALWSPFVLVGLIPYCLYLGVYALVKKKFEIFSIPNILGSLVLFSLTILYFTSSQAETFSYFITKEVNLSEKWVTIVLFWLIEFGVLGILAFSYKRFLSDRYRPLYSIALICLLLIPFYHMGIYNDFVSRVSIPSLMIFQIFILKSPFFDLDFKDPLASKFFILTLILCAFVPTAEIMRSVNGYNLSFEYGELTRVIGDKTIQSQYQGNPDSFFYKYIAR